MAFMNVFTHPGILRRRAAGNLPAGIEKAVVQSLQQGHLRIDSNILKQVSEKYGKRYVDPKLVLRAASSGSSMQSPPALPTQAETSEQSNTTTL